mgnify:CR=1 FL=1
MKRIMLSARRPVLLGLVVSVCGWVGCGSDEPPMGSVSGKVTYEGQPLTADPQGFVTIVDDKTGSGASAAIDTSGNYHIPSVLIGEYAVSVHSMPPPPGGEWIKLDIPEKYQDLESSGLSVTVEEGENHAAFDL